MPGNGSEISKSLGITASYPLLIPNIDMLQAFIKGDIGISDKLTKESLFLNFNNPIAQKDPKVLKSFAKNAKFDLPDVEKYKKEDGKIKIPKEVMILKQVLILEFIVQIIEFSFYLWMVYNFDKLVNITPYRYWDWALTTPTMLISLCIYLLYLKNLEEKKVIEENLIQILFENASILVPVVILNFLMLILGYLGETKVISFKLATFLGFIPFLLYFYLIYENFAKFTVYGINIFFIFSFIWALYGVANLLSYKMKNEFRFASLLFISYLIRYVDAYTLGSPP
jgi:hypothetical protein